MKKGLVFCPSLFSSLYLIKRIITVQSVMVYWKLTWWTLNTRSAAQPIDEDDNVELDKSNVLLMGPTGSGMSFCFYDLIKFFYSLFCTLPVEFDMIIYSILQQ